MNNGPLQETTPTRKECLALLSTANIGRIAISVEALPVVVPVAFALAGEEIVFRPPLDQKFASAALDVVLAFQIDDVDVASGSGWSVLVQGSSRPVRDQHDIEHCRGLAVPLLEGSAADGCFARLATSRLCGHRFVSG